MADYTQQGLYQEGNSLFDDIFAFGDLEVQNINVVGIITAKTFSGVDATSLKDDGGTVKIQATTTGATHSGRAVFSEVELQGKVYDSDGDFGSSGQVLSSDGTDIEWVNAGSLSAGSAAQISVSQVSDQTLTFPVITGNSTGNQTPRSNTNLTFNSTNGTLSSTSFSGNLTGNVTGTIQTAAQTNITSVGTLTGLDVNGTLNVQNGNSLDFGTATNNNIRGQIQATETNDQHLIIATSGGEDIAFKDGGVNGTTNMIIRGDGNVLVNNGTLSATTFSGSGASLTDLPAGQLTGTIPDGRLSSSSLFVTGMIIMWNSTVASIPSGWVLCDGNNSTPDLRDRFIVGAGTGGSYSPGNTGGAASVTLSVAQMPSHSHSTNSHAHSFSGSGSNTHSHGIPKGQGGSQASIANYVPSPRVENVQASFSSDSATISISVSGTTGGEAPNTNPDGGGGSHENRPPYYALCYIMKT